MEHATDLVNGAPRQRRFASRSRAGCITCRQRRKRCSGAPPECEACERLNLECTWAPKSQVSASRRTRSAVQAASSPALQNNLYAAWDFGTVQPDHSVGFPLTQSPTDVGRLDSGTLEQRMLMSHYIHSLVPNVSVANIPSNFFTSVFIPLAFHCDAVRSGILACSSVHLSKIATDSLRKIQLSELSSKYEATCLQFLQTAALSQKQTPYSALESVAVLLMVIASEVVNGTCTSNWISHVNQARGIIQQIGGEEAFRGISWEANRLYHMFLYYDVMSFIMSRVVHAEDDCDQNILEDYSLNLLALDNQETIPWEIYISEVPILPEQAPRESGYVDPLLGMSSDLFRIIQRIRHLGQAGKTGEHSDSTQIRLFNDLESQIINLQFQLPLASEAAQRLDVATRLDLCALAEINRLVALILLYRRSEAHKNRQFGLACQIISLIERIPPGSSVEVGLTYPLFLAGSQLDQKDEVHKCTARLAMIRERVNVMNILPAEKALEEIWRERLNGGHYWDWEDVLKKRNWVLNLG